MRNALEPFAYGELSLFELEVVRVCRLPDVPWLHYALDMAIDGEVGVRPHLKALELRPVGSREMPARAEDQPVHADPAIFLVRRKQVGNVVAVVLGDDKLVHIDKRHPPRLAPEPSYAVAVGLGLHGHAPIGPHRREMRQPELGERFHNRNPAAVVVKVKMLNPYPSVVADPFREVSVLVFNYCAHCQAVCRNRRSIKKPIQ